MRAAIRWALQLIVMAGIAVTVAFVPPVEWTQAHRMQPMLDFCASQRKKTATSDSAAQWNPAGYPITASAIEYLKSQMVPAFIQREWLHAQYLAGGPGHEEAITVDKLRAAFDLDFPVAKSGDDITIYPEEPRIAIQLSGAHVDALEGSQELWSVLSRVAREQARCPHLGCLFHPSRPLAHRASQLMVETAAAYALAVIERAHQLMESDSLGVPDLVRVRNQWISEKEPPASGPPKPYFKNVIADTGIQIEVSSQEPSESEKFTSVPGRGVGVADYDGDGLLDVAISTKDGVRLFRNTGDLHFEDVTQKAALDPTIPDGAVCWGDYDNSGHPSLLLTGIGGWQLWHNKGDGTFENVTQKAGLLRMTGSHPKSATWVPTNNDGWLDLFIVGGPNPTQRPHVGNARNGTPCLLFHNNHDGTFTEVSQKAGVNDSGWGEAVAVADYDSSGWQSIYVCNDFGINSLFKNDGSGVFKNLGPACGVDDNGHGMGCSFCDLEGLGYPSIALGNVKMSSALNSAMGLSHMKSSDDTSDRQLGLLLPNDFNRNMFATEENRIYINHHGYFEELTDALIDPQASTGWAWDTKFVDFDCDGYMDVYSVNGTLHGLPFSDFKNSLLRWNGWNFQDVTLESGADIMENSRSMAIADFNRDGAPDILISTMDGQPALLLNQCKGSNHTLTVRLQGVKSNRDGRGAKVKVSAGGHVQVRDYTPNNGYLSTDAPELYFGLGQSTTVTELSIHWPSGHVDTYSSLPADRTVTIVEGSSAPKIVAETPITIKP